MRARRSHLPLSRRARRALLAAFLLGASCRGERPAGDARFTGSAACAGCHAEAARAWAGSGHALALRAAAPDAVRAPFDGALRAFASLPVRPRRDGAHLLFDVPPGEGRSGETLPLAWVMGGVKIEQFFTPAAGGRLQGLPAAYDTVAGEWFDLFPDAPPPEDWSHWANRGMTANSQCLPCHVTGWVKGYDPASDAWASGWAEAGVGCEACHGPGAAHVARRRRGEREPEPPYGAVAPRADTPTTCAPCHSRRTEIAPGWVPGAPLYDHFDPELLDTGVYHPDGQVREEAYEYTSFEMSRMAARGVVCQDCHEPHTARLRADGNALCLRCHDAGLDTPAHTHHAADGAGGRCVDCHMPTKTFMQRDVRRDHRIAAPDPAAAEALGAPDACRRCHAERPDGWSASWVARWWGDGARRSAARAVATAVRDGHAGEARAVPALLALLASDADVVRRASAARLLGAWTTNAEVTAGLLAAGGDASPLVRARAAASLGEVSVEDARARGALVRATRDPVRLVRIEAGYALRAVDPLGLAAADRTAVEAAGREWLAAEEPTAELPEPNFNRGVFLAARGRTADAEAALRTAIRRWPLYLPARENLALLLAKSGRPAAAETELRAALERAPGWPPAAFSLALLYGGQGRWAEAAAALEACVARDPAYPRAYYNLGLAYARLNDLPRASAALERATADPAARGEALRELIRIAHARGDTAALERWLPEVLDSPGTP